MPARCFLVSGRVQGVHFRAATSAQARQLGLTGHARNLADGRVEVVAEGSAAALAQLAAWLSHGPPAARVDHVLEQEVEATGRVGFEECQANAIAGVRRR